jgi:hypothetical protein
MPPGRRQVDRRRRGGEGCGWRQGFTGPEARNGRSARSVSGGAPAPVAGGTALDVLQRLAMAEDDLALKKWIPIFGQPLKCILPVAVAV